MKVKCIFPIMITALVFSLYASLTLAEERSLLSQLWAFNGKAYKGRQDPQFIAYDLVLRNYLVDRINKRFSIVLDPKKYSGFDLLEIEAFFKCKKSNEPFDIFIKMFPKQP